MHARAPRLAGCLRRKAPPASTRKGPVTKPTHPARMAPRRGGQYGPGAASDSSPSHLLNLPPELPVPVPAPGEVQHHRHSSVPRLQSASFWAPPCRSIASRPRHPVRDRLPCGRRARGFVPFGRQHSCGSAGPERGPAGHGLRCGERRRIGAPTPITARAADLSRAACPGRIGAPRPFGLVPGRGRRFGRTGAKPAVRRHPIGPGSASAARTTPFGQEPLARAATRRCAPQTSARRSARSGSGNGR